jgi:uncharacterized delta-60 repeat protein
MCRIILIILAIPFVLVAQIDSVELGWVQHYGSGLAASDDIAVTLAVDDMGNIYVTGESQGSVSASDYNTIKYNPDGTEVWVARYNGPGNSYDGATALVVDLNGYVYVTGRSHGSDSGDDYATIKYDPDGTEVWVARYNGPGNLSDGAAALVVDTDGNVYVTGISVGSDSDDDYATIKYDSDGTEVWVARYNGPGNLSDWADALVVDTNGYVYVTGSVELSVFDDDYTTIKYNPDGTEAWVARYSGPGNSYDWAATLAVDTDGNVYVAGSSIGSGSHFDFTTIKYNPDGIEIWVARHTGPENNFDGAADMVVDTAGNIYVTGNSRRLESPYPDYATIKYTSDGTEVWVNRYNGPDDGHDRASSLAIGLDGNIYVTGYSEGLESDQDYATIKYNPDGTEVWVSRYNGSENGYDDATAMVVDTDGNICVTGYSQGSNSGQDYATIKYNPDGTEVWVDLCGVRPIRFI